MLILNLFFGLLATVSSQYIGTADRTKAAQDIDAATQYTFDVPEGSVINLLLEARSSNETSLHFNWEWADVRPIFLFDWSAQPSADDLSGFFDFYLWPADDSGSVTWDKVLDKSDDGFYHDIFHCWDHASNDKLSFTDPCPGNYKSEEHVGDTGTLFVTIETITTTEEASNGDFVLTWQLPRPNILSSHFDALKDIYDTNCGQDCTWTDLKADTQGVSNADALWSGMFFKNDADTNYGCSGSCYGSCQQLEGVYCDPTGNVVELYLTGLGLDGDLPSSIGDLEKLEKLGLDRNGFEGAPPAAIFELDDLVHLTLASNKFTGSFPCPANSQIGVVGVNNNLFSGELDADCIAKMTKLTTFSASSNKLSGSLPAFSSDHSNLNFVHLEQNMFSGSIPDSYKAISKLTYLGLSRNQLEGELSEAFLSGLVQLYQLDLSYNKLSGSFPKIPSSLADLRLLDVANNAFTGDISEQLDTIQSMIHESTSSTVDIQGNMFSGPLPSSVVDLISGDTPLTHFYLQNNHFVCASGSSWDDNILGVPLAAVWNKGSRSTHDLGICEKRPVVSSVEGAPSGGEVRVTGDNFVASNEFKCSFDGSDAVGYYVSSTEALCVVPEDMSTGDEVTKVSIANYGSDYSSEDAIGFTVTAPPAAGTPAWVVPVVVIIVLFVVIFAAFSAVLVAKERGGKPMFAKVLLDDGDTELPSRA